MQIPNGMNPIPNGSDTNPERDEPIPNGSDAIPNGTDANPEWERCNPEWKRRESEWERRDPRSDANYFQKCLPLINMCLDEVSTGSGSDLVVSAVLGEQEDQVATAPCTDLIQPSFVI